MPIPDILNNCDGASVSLYIALTNSVASGKVSTIRSYSVLLFVSNLKMNWPL